MMAQTIASPVIISDMMLFKRASTPAKVLLALKS